MMPASRARPLHAPEACWPIRLSIPLPVSFYISLSPAPDRPITVDFSKNFRVMGAALEAFSESCSHPVAGSQQHPALAEQGGLPSAGRLAAHRMTCFTAIPARARYRHAGDRYPRWCYRYRCQHHRQLCRIPQGRRRQLRPSAKERCWTFTDRDGATSGKTNQKPTNLVFHPYPHITTKLTCRYGAPAE